jgi:hypothetical protein
MNAPDGYEKKIENLDGSDYYQDSKGRWYMIILDMDFGTNVYEQDVIDSCKAAKEPERKALLMKHFRMVYNRCYCN